VTNSNGTLIAGNAIGSGEGGTVPLANGAHGIAVIGSSNVTIGGDTSGEDNEVSGNAGNGIYINGGTNNRVLNNAIGIDGNGVVGVANGAAGVFLDNTVNPTVDSAMVSGNASHGIRIIGGSGARITGNFIGTNLASNAAIPNGGSGIHLDNTSAVTIGGTVSGDGNVISGNIGSGVSLFQSSGNTITANLIGLNLGATLALPNMLHGIHIQSSSGNTIGGPAQNFIAANARSGVAILSGSNNVVRLNRIWSNGELAIDLDRNGVAPFDGVTTNDPTDADTGGNNLQNAPILTAATTTSVSGLMKGAASTQFLVDVYINSSCDPAGFGEGMIPLAQTSVMTNGSGVAPWTINFGAQGGTTAFSAVATDPSGNTSEFAQCILPSQKPLETLTLFRPSNGTVGLITTLTTPLPATAVSSYAAGAPLAGQWVMGDWNGDGIDTPAVYATDGHFWYTNDVNATGSWTPIWFGLIGRPPVGGRFNGGLPNDCLGVVDSAPSGPDTAFALYYTCSLTSGSNPPKLGQWLSLPLPNSGGFTGTHQWATGDFDNNGVDSMAVRRGELVTWTNVAPPSGHAAFNFAQYFGTPPGASGEGNVAVGDWNGDGFSSFGLYYQNGAFRRRNDLVWNSGVYVAQEVGQPIGTPTTVATWRAGGSAP
jgi:hypothetical protein